MTGKSRRRFPAYICIAVLCASSALRAQEAKPRLQSDAYRVEYVFSEWQDNKKINARTYTILVRQMEKASVRLGSRIPIATGSFPSGGSKELNPLVNTQFQYIDLGVNIDCVVEPLDSDAVLSTNVDINRLAPEQPRENRTGNPIVRQTKIQVHNLVPLGKSTLLSSADEVDGTGRFQIDATVTKVK